MQTHPVEVLTAVPVPFGHDGRVLMDTYEAMLARVLRHTDGVFVNGTTAEFPALEDGERKDLLRSAVATFGAQQVVAHIGAPSLRQVLRLAEAAAGLGITRLAALTPYYLPCDFDQIHDFYVAITREFSDTSVFVYLFPERSGIDVSPEELAQLTAIDGVEGAKLSGRPNDHFRRYVEHAVAGSLIYSGDDGSYPQVVEAGGAGIVSGVSSAFPEMFSELNRTLRLTREATAASEAQDRVVAAVQAVGPTITRLKYALAARYGETWNARMPLPAVADETRTLIDSLVAGEANG